MYTLLYVSTLDSNVEQPLGLNLNLSLGMGMGLATTMALTLTLSLGFDQICTNFGSSHRSRVIDSAGCVKINCNLQIW